MRYEPVEASAERGLSASTRPRQKYEFTFLDLDCYVLERRFRPDRISIRQAFGFDDR